MTLPDDALRVLQETSRTFFVPIRQLPAGLQEAIASAYLCMRAIDEIEDHPHLKCGKKISLLRQVSRQLQAQTSVEDFPPDAFLKCFVPHQACLPEVTLRLADWLCLAPEEIAPRIWEAIAAMAEADLDRYTYGVAGATGVLLCDLWAWAGGEQLHRSAAIQFGRGLQAVNILRNRAEDLARGVDFFPTGRTSEQMRQYAWGQVMQAEVYALTLPSAAFEALIHVPLALAKATLDALERGETKLSRSEVLSIVGQIQTQARGNFPAVSSTYGQPQGPIHCK
ncbi:MAG: squalene/phytoene synthase family protein [Ktedonobacteraceae bacterium]